MKTPIFISILLILSTLLHAQSKKEALTSDTIVWYGIDFSEARFMDKQAFKSAEDLKDNKFNEWNRLILAEPKKYNISKFFNVDSVKIELSDVYSRNEKVDASKIILDLPNLGYEFNAETVNQMVSQYTSDIEGYGLVLIVESFNKISAKGNIWVTFFHIPTKKVVFTKRLTGEPVGFGIKNYWAGSIYDVLKQTMDLKPVWKNE